MMGMGPWHYSKSAGHGGAWLRSAPAEDSAEATAEARDVLLHLILGGLEVLLDLLLDRDRVLLELFSAARSAPTLVSTRIRSASTSSKRLSRGLHELSVMMMGSHLSPTFESAARISGTARCGTVFDRDRDGAAVPHASLEPR